MRWDELFADLEGQLEAGVGAEEREREAEEERLRLGRLGLRDRIAAMGAVDRDRPVRLLLDGGASLDLLPRTFGRDWIAGDLARAGARQAVVPLAAIAAVVPDAAQLAGSFDPPPPGALTDRLGLPFVLRDLARRRSTVEVVGRADSTTGTIDRVGRDHLDLAVHPIGDWRRADAVRQVRVIAISGVVLVRVH